MKFRIIILLSINLTFISGQNIIKLPAVFSDNMVLQQLSDAAIWGKSTPDTKIDVKSSWGDSASTIVESDSTWKLKLKTPIAGGPYTIFISNGYSTFKISNVLIGEVWLCSGQSNMEMPLKGWPPNDIIQNSENEIINSRNNKIRFFTVAKDISVEEKDNCIGEWVESMPSTAADFSATAYFFGSKLYDELKIPIGLIHSSWGGTPAESWTNRKYLSQLSEFDSTLKLLDKSLPASRVLTEWLEKFPQINIAQSPKSNIWSNLDFNDSECSKIEYDHSEWKSISLPTQWEKTDIGEFDGAIWFRKIVELPNSWLKKDLRIELGPIDDYDISFVNGVKIGGIEEDGNWQTKRIYTIDKKLNNNERLVIAVRVNDTQGGGGIYGKPEDMKIVNVENSKEIPIAGKWHYLPVAEFKGMVYYVFGSKDQVFNNRPALPIPISSSTPSFLYNGMIAPLVPFSIKGVIWYQGESNVGNPKLYERLFPSLISNWRADFGVDLPFYFVQIAPYNYGENSKSEELRDAQRNTLMLNNTGMVVTLDIGDTSNIHPTNKKDVGERLALWALAKQYSKNLVYSGPLYKNLNIIENKIMLDFENIGSGLEFRNKVSQFEIAGANKIFVSAYAEIVNNKVFVWADEIINPLAVRYAWSNNSIPCLFNVEGLPASSFRTDDWVE